LITTRNIENIVRPAAHEEELRQVLKYNQENMITEQSIIQEVEERQLKINPF
jgi:hypothetical protein